MLIFIIIRSDYYYSRTLAITEFASSSCRTKRNGLDLRCALYFSTRSAFSTAIFASSRTLASCSSSSSTLFQLSFPLQNKKIFTLHFTRYARFASYLEENRDRYVCFRTNRFPRCFAYYIPLPRSLQPSLPFLIPSLSFSLPLCLGLFPNIFPLPNVLFLLSNMSLSLEVLLIRNSFAHSSQPPRCRHPRITLFAWIF